MADAPPPYAVEHDPSYQPEHTTAPEEETVSSQPQPQIVVVVPQPVPQQQVVYVDQNGNPIQPPQGMVQAPAIYNQNIPLQVANTGNVPGMEGGNTITNLDELPPNYEDIINGTYDAQLSLKEGVGLAAGCAGHKKSWICSLYLWTFLILVIVIFGIMQFELWQVIWLAPFIGISVMCWCCYSCEWICGSSMKYLSTIHDKEFVYQDVQRLHTVQPVIVWRVECYHYRTTTDSKGRKRRKKVVTHRANTNYLFNSWRDISAPFSGLEEWRMTKLTLYKTFTFGNAQTEADYNANAAAFRAANNRDTHQSFTVAMELIGFKPKILVEAMPGQRSTCLNKETYALFSCFLCSPCYKTWFSSNTGKKHYIIQKEISL